LQRVRRLRRAGDDPDAHQGRQGLRAGGSDEIIRKELLLVMHPECYDRIGPEEQQRLLEEAAGL